MMTQTKVEKIYKALLEETQRNVKNRNYDKALSTIDVFAMVAEKVNDIFREDVIEDTLKYIGESQIKIKKVNVYSNSTNKIVFYDQIGTTICLALQYLRALKSLGYEIFYIYEQRFRQLDPNLKEEVESVCAQTAYSTSGYSMEEAKRIQQLIVDYGASKLIAHSPCFGAMGSSIFYSLSGIEKYKIIPGDHHFYIGVDCFDHFIEFRDFGINVAINERKIPIEKISRLPYYPIVKSNMQFHGFPKIVKDKVIIAAAARELKFHGSEWFFDFSKYILDNYSNVVILFIGGKSQKVLDFVEKNQLQNRFVALGYRTDFIECMKHIDIFFNSYPWGSALTSMTAAFFSKPIISYHDEIFELESLNSWMVPQNGRNFSFSNEQKLRSYVQELLNDSAFRIKEGMRAKQSLCSPAYFAANLEHILRGEQVISKYAKLPSKVLAERTKMYLDCQNTYYPQVVYLLHEIYGNKFFRIFPFLIFERMMLFCKLKMQTFKSLSKRIIQHKSSCHSCHHSL